MPVGHSYLGAPVQLPREQVLSALTPIFIDPERPKIGQNIKYDYQVLRKSGVEMQGLWCDTMLASYLLNPVRSSHGLDSLAVEFLDHRMIFYQEVAGKGKEQINFAQVPVEQASVYSCEDADATFLLQGIFLPRLTEAGMDSLFFDLEMPLVKIIAEMELQGVKLDLPLLRELSGMFADQLAILEKEIFASAGCEFNINSPKQLGEVLLERLKLPAGRKTKTGWSTDSGVLSPPPPSAPLGLQQLQYSHGAN